MGLSFALELRFSALIIALAPSLGLCAVSNLLPTIYPASWFLSGSRKPSSHVTLIQSLSTCALTQITHQAATLTQPSRGSSLFPRLRPILGVVP